MSIALEFHFYDYYFVFGKTILFPLYKIAKQLRQMILMSNTNYATFVIMHFNPLHTLKNRSFNEFSNFVLTFVPIKLFSKNYHESICLYGYLSKEVYLWTNTSSKLNINLYYRSNFINNYSKY